MDPAAAALLLALLSFHLFRDQQGTWLRLAAVLAACLQRDSNAQFYTFTPYYPPLRPIWYQMAGRSNPSCDSLSTLCIL